MSKCGNGLGHDEHNEKETKRPRLKMSYTIFPDYILDEVMPKLTPNGWRLFCFVWRKTEGWNKESDELSYSQIASGTGIGSKNTISNAIKDVSQFVTVEAGIGRSNMCRFNVAELKKSIETIPFIDKGTESEPLEEENGIETIPNAEENEIKGIETIHTKESISISSYEEIEVITAHEILENPKDYTIKQIQQVMFTRSQYLQLRKKEKSLGKPRRGLLRHIKDKLEPKPEAVEVYRSVAYTYPEKCIWDDIEKAVGDKPNDLELWRDVVKNYIGLGWNKTNVVNMLGYFERREIPTMNGQYTNGYHQEPKEQLVITDKRTGELI